MGSNVTHIRNIVRQGDIPAMWVCLKFMLMATCCYRVYEFIYNDIKKFSILKNGIGIECQKSTKTSYR